jgi:hypothetical protein
LKSLDQCAKKQEGMMRRWTAFVPFSEPTPENCTLFDGSKTMDVTKILAELRDERQQIEEAILSLERLARGRGRRRGRPPAWIVEARKRARLPVGKKGKPESGTKSAVA